MVNQIRIKDHVGVLVLDYASFLVYHGGGAVAGAAIGFRAMECAGIALSGTALWDRKDLTVTTRHSGPGVRDAIEYVTRAVTRDRYQVDEQHERNNPCLSAASFYFLVGDGRSQVEIALRAGLVKPAFFTAVRRYRDSGEGDREREELEVLKEAVAAHVLAKPLAELFRVKVQNLQHETVLQHA